ncbi:MAG: AAA family ATPase [Candidatus Kerfeldbacteria bacterium]
MVGGNEKGNKQGETETHEEHELSLPELKLNQLVRSENPIDGRSDGRSSGTGREVEPQKIEAIQPWNNYTIVSLERGSDIEIYDENAKKITDIQSNITNKTITSGYWSDSSSKLHSKSYIAKKSSTNNQISVDDIPIELRGQARKALGTNNMINIRSGGIDNETVSNVAVLPDNNLVMFSKDGAVITLVTKNEHGVELAPRDWKRLNPKDEYSEELRENLERVVGEQEGYVEINGEYSVQITDIGINIMKNDDPKGQPIYTETIPSVERNIAVDPNNSNIFYFSRTSSPREIRMIDLGGNDETTGSFTSIGAPIPENYDSISNLQLDPKGNFFLFYSGDDLIVMTKDTLKEVKRESNLSHVDFDNNGNIRAIDKDGHLVIHEANFDELAGELDKHRIQSATADLNIDDIFTQQAAKNEQAGLDNKSMDKLDGVRDDLQTKFKEMLETVSTHEGLVQARDQFNTVRQKLQAGGLRSEEIDYVIEGLEKPIQDKEKMFAKEAADKALKLVRTKLEGGLSFGSISEIREILEDIKSQEGFLISDQRLELAKARTDLDSQIRELFEKRGGEVKKDIDELISKTKKDLESFETKMQMDDWLEFRYPQIKARLSSINHDIPFEADEIYKQVQEARTSLDLLAEEYEHKFKIEYAKVREKASERIEAHVDTLQQEISSLEDRLQAQGFKDRTAGEQYLGASEAKKYIETEIEALADDDPDAAKELKRMMKVRLSNALTEIERGGMTTIADTGKQMVSFGDTRFPKWESKVKEREERSVDIAFEEDSKTRGPGISAKDIQGDIILNINTGDGKNENVRLYEGMRDEQEWRLGLQSYKGESIPPSYITAEDFKNIKKKYNDWNHGEDSKLRQEWRDNRKILRELYSTRKKISERTDEDEDKEWQDKYSEAYKKFGTFCAENNIPLLQRINRIKNQPNIETSNGKGFIPEWQSHWVTDNETEDDLENMAGNLKMQMDLQEGMLVLKGHAGTGKDVRVKMFCNMTNRPYFGMDGTKWTTEFELSEDVMLESKDGASQTVKIPSTILNGIRTPGAVVYFNEFNAMPEQAQIFLHALMDEKRSLTLKTSSGKTIKALSSVLLVGSMNPNYPGTFDPQFATRSRMVSQEIGYPQMTREANPDDPNKRPMYDSSEALRIARGVDSLADLTFEASMDHNEFVKLWDQYVNGIDNGVDKPTLEQKFDIDTILTLVQFANKLREDFIKNFEKGTSSRKALPVTQPITGRELRRCAYTLSRMTTEEKTSSDPENTARELLEKYFLTHIDKKEDQEKIRKALKTWTSQKRVTN